MISRAILGALMAFSCCLAEPAVGATYQAAQQPSADPFDLDRRVATIGHRLAVASIDLCGAREWLPGFVPHDLSQYPATHRDALIRALRLDRGPGVMVLATGGPAERAGLRAGDVLIEVDGSTLPRAAESADSSFDTAGRILDALEAAFADGRAVLRIERDGETLSVQIEGEKGCASRFQVMPGRQLNAYATGEYVQVTRAIGNYVRDDNELAAVLAHEFAHNVLRHRARLDQADVRRGFLGNFGRNARLIRETEVEADRLSVYLLERAGFDLDSALGFWTRFSRHGLNFLGSQTHPNWRLRIDLF